MQEHLYLTMQVHLLAPSTLSTVDEPHMSIEDQEQITRQLYTNSKWQYLTCLLLLLLIMQLLLNWCDWLPGLRTGAGSSSFSSTDKPWVLMMLQLSPWSSLNLKNFSQRLLLPRLLPPAMLLR